MKPLDRLDDEELVRAARRAMQALPDAPPAWQKAAIGLFPAAPSLLASAATTVLRQLQAVLSFDSWAQPALAGGMRSGGSATRHLLYSVDGRDIDLRITAAGEFFGLAGQVLGPDEAGVAELAPRREGSAAHQAPLDSLGEFRIDGVRRGSYLLTLRLGGDEIVLPSIEVGEPAR